MQIVVINAKIARIVYKKQNMYWKGCPHSKLSIMFSNSILGKNLIHPWILSELDVIAQKSANLLSDSSNYNDILSYFYNLNQVEWKSILDTFIVYFQENLHISIDEFKKYEKYSRKRGWVQWSNDSIPQLLWYAFSDIYCLLLLHINLWYPISKVKWLIIRSMVLGNADFKYTPTWLITAITWFNEPEEMIEKIDRILKKYIPQKTWAHSYGEPSCPFLLSSEVDKWIDKVIEFMLNELIPGIQERYRWRTKNFQEVFFSWNLKNS